MGYYTYKGLCNNIPTHYEETFEENHKREFDYDSNYNGDYWIIAANIYLKRVHRAAMLVGGDE